jgi:hypothetical protein
VVYVVIGFSDRVSSSTCQVFVSCCEKAGMSSSEIPKIQLGKTLGEG